MDSVYLFIFTQIASTEGFVVAVILIYIFLRIRHRKQQAIFFAASAVLLMFLVQTLKNFLHIPRPPDALIEVSGYAFPSGHAAGALFLALGVIFLTRNVSAPLRYCLWTLTGLIAILIGVSRTQLGVHTPLQVIAGYALGALCAWLYIAMNKRFR